MTDIETVYPRPGHPATKVAQNGPEMAVKKKLDQQPATSGKQTAPGSSPAASLASQHG